MQEQEANPEIDTPISELFARDPLRHTDQSIASIVEHLRKQRHRFKQGDKTAGSPKPPSKTTVKQNEAMAIGGDALNKLDL